MQVGIIKYRFPNTPAPGTRELFARVGLDALPLAPTVTRYQDIDEADGAYASVAVGHTVPAGTVSIGLSASAGWGSAGDNGWYFGVPAAGLNDGNLGLAAAGSGAGSPWGTTSRFRAAPVPGAQARPRGTR